MINLLIFFKLHIFSIALPMLPFFFLIKSLQHILLLGCPFLAPSTSPSSPYHNPYITNIDSQYVSLKIQNGFQKALEAVCSSPHANIKT